MNARHTRGPTLRGGAFFNASLAILDPKPVEVPSFEQRPLDTAVVVQNGLSSLLGVCLVVILAVRGVGSSLMRRLIGAVLAFFSGCAAAHFGSLAYTEVARPRYEPFPMDAFVQMVFFGLLALVAYRVGHSYRRQQEGTPRTAP